jgi:hypothetical protein
VSACPKNESIFFIRSYLAAGWCPHRVMALREAVSLYDV